MPVQSRYTWDLNKLQFRDARTGRYVPPAHVFRQVNQVISVSQRRMVKLADQVRSGAITIEQFKLAMRTEVKSLHIATAIAGNGGLAQMTPARWGAVGGRLRSEYQFLNNFGAALDTAQLPLQSGRVRSRARAYTANARLAYWETLNERMDESGMIVEASRKLGPVQTEHCGGCASVAGVWMALEELPRLGSMECRWFCACSILYRMRRSPQLKRSETRALEEELVDQSTDGVLASELTRREREVLETIRQGMGHFDEKLLAPAERKLAEGLLERGALTLEEEDGHYIYYLVTETPAPAPSTLADAAALDLPEIPKPFGHLTAAERGVFNRIAAEANPVALQKLKPFESQLAHRLVMRGELRRVKRDGMVWFEIRTHS